MSTDVAEQEQQVEQTAAQEEADFNKGFGAAPEQSAPAPEEKKDEPKAEGTDQPAATEAPKEDAPAQSPRIAGMTEEEWNAAVGKGVNPALEDLRKEIRKNFGQIGELTRTINDLKAAKGSQPSRKITADLLKRVNDELPGLGAALAEDLTEILGGADKAQEKAEAKGEAFDEAKYHAEKVVPELQKLRNEMELRFLKQSHPDYLTVVYADAKAKTWTPEFSAWVKSQTPEKQKSIVDSNDAQEIAGFLTEYKAHAEKAKKEKDRKTQRLETTVTPQGSPPAPGSTTNDEDADFNKGFKQAGKKYAR